jgi:hypothetical protein
MKFHYERIFQWLKFYLDYTRSNQRNLSNNPAVQEFQTIGQQQMFRVPASPSIQLQNIAPRANDDPMEKVLKKVYMTKLLILPYLIKIYLKIKHYQQMKKKDEGDVIILSIQKINYHCICIY